MTGHIPADRAQEAGSARLRMIIKSGDELGGADLLGFVLDLAVTEAGGLGGMVHLRGPGGRGLLLMAAHGLARTVAREWAEITENGPTAPARAVADGLTVRTPAGAAPSTAGSAGGPARDTADGPVPDLGAAPDVPGPAGRGAPRAQRDPVAPASEAVRAAPALPSGSGLLAFPLLTPGGTAGALSVLTPVGGGPGPRQRAAVEALAAWAAGRLREQPVAPGRDDAALVREQPPAARLRQALQAVRVGSWDWDLVTGDVVWDEPTLAIFGMEGESPHQHIDTWQRLVQPDDLPWLLVEIEQTLRHRGMYNAEYRIRRPDGNTAWVNARARVLVGDDGEPVRLVGTVWDTTESRISRDSVNRALRHMSDAFFALDQEWRITFVNVEAERLFGASQELVGRTLWSAFESIGVDASALGLEARYRQAAASGSPVGFDVRWPADHRWYHMRLVPVPEGLTVYATDVTESRSRATERAAAEHAATERNARISELTGALAEALTMEDVVNAVAERVLPPFGAAGLIVQIIDERETVRVVGAVGYPQEFLDGLDGLPAGDLSPVAEVHRTRTPTFVDSLDEYTRRYPEMTGRLSPSGKQAWAFLPLLVSGRNIGCCCISFGTPRHLSGEERALLATLSGLMAQAIERARLYDTEHTRAQELQQALLPRTLPSLPAVTTAVRYLPATEGVAVGGDWYDVIPLSGGRVALVIGDVMGHGLSEAATMGRLRTAVHTLADLEFAPAELLGRLNDLVNNLGDDFYVTCLYAVYDPVSATCVFARAGHPPPAVVRPGGTAEFPDRSPDPPLGAASPPFETAEVSLPEGSLLVLYTDGLVESATRDIDAGTRHLASVLSGAATGWGQAAGSASGASPGPAPGRGRPPERAGAGEPPGDGGEPRGQGDRASLERLCDDVLAALVPDDQLTDDAALLIARTHTTAPGDTVTWMLSDGPIAAGEAREHVREQLAHWDLDPLTMTAELLVSELVGNAVRHGRSPVGLRLLRSEGLICEVSDSSLSTPRIRHASETDEGGRGLQLVAALSQRWGARYTATGKCIWTEQPLP